MATNDQRRAEPDRSTASRIASHGFAVNSVGYGMCSVPGCHCAPRERHPWTYTVGLTGLGQPELVLMGLDPVPAHFAISWVAAERRAGRPVLLDQPFLIDGHPAKVVDVPDDWVLADPARMAAWFAHYGAMSDVLPDVEQLLWADAAGLFPDDPQCAGWVVREQPILRDAPLHHPRRVAGQHERHRRRRRVG
jgi:hypothetical protein